MPTPSPDTGLVDAGDDRNGEIALSADPVSRKDVTSDVRPGSYSASAMRYSMPDDAVQFGS